jgi:prefoldin subunit 5
MALTEDDLDQISELISEQSLDIPRGLTELDVERFLRQREDYLAADIEKLEYAINELSNKFDNLQTDHDDSIRDLREDYDSKVADLEDTIAELRQEVRRLGSI